MSLFNMIIRCSILVDCNTNNSVNAATIDLSRYTTAYIEQSDEDACYLRSFIMTELRDMGLRIGDEAPKSPVSTDLLVRFNYYNGWDLGNYLKKIQIQLMDGPSQEVLYSTSYHAESNGRSHEQEHV
ncbi:MAG: hypothetical protein WC156_06870 [Pedobacter sp.]